MTKEQISREILAALSGWDAPAAEPVVFAQVGARLPGRVLVSEWDAALAWCENSRWVTGVRDPLRGMMFAITNKGRAQLAQ